MYSKAIIDLIREARRRVSSEQKPSIKLANPEVFEELNDIYHQTNDAILKALVKELFHLMGEGWSEKLTVPTETSATVNLVAGIPLTDSNKRESETKKVPKRIYRGQVIPD